MFQRVRKEKPQTMKKVVALNGDVSMENLGLSSQQMGTLMNEIDVVFHLAATLRLESKLKDAIVMNTVNLIKLPDRNFLYLIISFDLISSIDLSRRLAAPFNLLL